jgi:hypothetical protein
MTDFTRFVTNKLSGEWSASNVSGVLTDVIIEVPASHRRQRVYRLGPGIAHAWHAGCWRLRVRRCC